MWAQQDCSNRRCSNRISVVVTLCWSCLSKLPEGVREAYMEARSQMEKSHTPANIAAYRAARDAAIAHHNARAAA